MIVKPISFKKGGRYPTAVARAEYLQRDGRAVELGTQNIARGDSSWACEMDSTTAAYSCRGDVVAREYVLSPAPGDMATPAQMLDFGMQWAAENFPGHEASVVIHVDNRDRIARGLEPIPHAHVYINSVNLETGKKMHISRDLARRLHDSAQRMAMERGWSQQIEYQGPDGPRYIESQRGERDRRPQWQREPERANAEYERSAVAGKVSRYEYERAMSGRELDKTVVRRALSQVLAECPASGVELRRGIEGRGVEIARAADGDYKYRVAGHGMWFRGKTVGAHFAARQLTLAVAEIARESMEQGRDDSMELGL